MKQTTTLTRRYRGHIDDVWALWTTKEGIEAWWGPDGFAVDVVALDVRVGGGLVYEMFPTAPEMVAFMKDHGMPERTKTSLRFTDVRVGARLAWQNVVDFVPGTDPYETGTVVEFAVDGADVVVTVILEAMHDAVWSERQRAGWESELGRLAAALSSRQSPVTR
jgi:uncharacterized protein YndB with AHSA1/START domain